MNFFTSIFADDPEPESPPSNSVTDPTESDTHSPENPNPSSSSTPTSPEPPNPSLWAFTTLVKTLATQSESVIGTYRRDLEEFRSGLLKETAIVRDVASRAVKELPDSIDASAAAAQESLQSVGQVIDTLGSSVWEGTAKIVARGKELHLFDDDGGDGGAGAGYSDDGRDGYLGDRTLSVKKYSWFDARLREIRCDSRTYAEDPDDDEDYGKWREGFVMEEKGEEIMRLVGEEKEAERLYLELVPVTVDKDTFWSRYFYKVDKLKQAEEARSRIVKRAISGEDEEDLSWDVDDDDSDDGCGDTVTEGNQSHSVSGAAENITMVKTSQEETPGLESNDKVLESNDKEVVQSSSINFDEEKTASSMDNARTSSASDTSSVVKVDEVKVSDEKGDNCNSCKDSDVSVVSTQPSLAGLEDLGWDEIEDVGSDNDDNNNKAAAASSSSTISDLRKRLSVAEDDEDLTWDIEDDDDPIKS